MNYTYISSLMKSLVVHNSCKNIVDPYNTFIDITAFNLINLANGYNQKSIMLIF